METLKSNSQNNDPQRIGVMVKSARFRERSGLHAPAGPSWRSFAEPGKFKEKRGGQFARRAVCSEVLAANAETLDERLVTLFALAARVVQKGPALCNHL